MSHSTTSFSVTHRGNRLDESENLRVQKAEQQQWRWRRQQSNEMRQSNHNFGRTSVTRHAAGTTSANCEKNTKIKLTTFDTILEKVELANPDEV